jgi:dTDP-4-dehydrorhamnose reductase
LSDRVSLVVGVDGTIGSALFRRLKGERSAVIGTTRREGRTGPDRLFLDLSHSSEIEGLRPSVGSAVIAAAVARLPACAKDPEGSRAVNVSHTVELARKLIATGVHVLFLSTDKVFDGSIAPRRAEDPRSATPENGRQKSEAESALLPLGVAVLRLTKVLGPGDALLAGWRRDLAAGRRIRAFSDMVMAPVPLSLVVEAAVRISRARAPGIFQLSGSHDVTYADAARYLAGRIGAPAALVGAVTTAEAGVDLGGPVARYTALDGGRLESEFGLRAPDVLATIEAASLAADDLAA